jgi:SHAQKYF class myb-like DNA-binding protein
MAVITLRYEIFLRWNIHLILLQHNITWKPSYNQMPGLRRRIDRSRSTKEESVNPDVTSEERESASAVGAGTAAAPEDAENDEDGDRAPSKKHKRTSALGDQGKNTGTWTSEEHRLFLQGLDQHGKGWTKIASLIKSRTAIQIRTHAVKYFDRDEEMHDDALTKRKRDQDDQDYEKRKKMNICVPTDDDDHVRWDALADTKWGRNPLTKYVSVRELDGLVGWATHQQSPVPVANVNPLLGLPNAPLQPSLLTYLENTVSEILSAQKKSDQWESFDQSALVAIGIALEEMVTTNLLPLAQLHVNRCRQLEAIPGNEEKLFSEWTLPPEEAVEKLVEKAKSQQEPGVCLATAYPSTRSIIPHAPGTSLLNQSTAERRSRDARLVWCRALGMEPAFVKNNMEALSIFLPH